MTGRKWYNDSLTEIDNQIEMIPISIIGLIFLAFDSEQIVR